MVSWGRGSARTEPSWSTSSCSSGGTTTTPGLGGGTQLSRQIPGRTRRASGSSLIMCSLSGGHHSHLASLLHNFGDHSFAQFLDLLWWHSVLSKACCRTCSRLLWSALEGGLCIAECLVLARCSRLAVPRIRRGIHHWFCVLVGSGVCGGSFLAVLRRRVLLLVGRGRCPLPRHRRLLGPLLVGSRWGASSLLLLVHAPLHASQALLHAWSSFCGRMASLTSSRWALAASSFTSVVQFWSGAAQWVVCGIGAFCADTEAMQVAFS